jgi:hypothetical protein
VLDNDRSPEGRALAVAQLGRPAHGTVERLEDGRIRYTPEADFHGPDAFWEDPA